MAIRVTPRSSRAKVQWDGTRLNVWVCSPPAEGQANQAVLKLLASALDVAPSTLSIVRGGHGREKIVEVCGIDLEQAVQRLLD